MIFYTSDGSIYEGMSQDLIISLRSELGRSTTFVDRETYDQFIATHQPA